MANSWRGSPFPLLAALMKFRGIDELEYPPHLRRLDLAVAAAITTRGGRLIVNMPPRHGKSLTAHVASLLWLLAEAPAAYALSISANAMLQRQIAQTLDDLLPFGDIDPRQPDFWSAAHKRTTSHGGIVFARTLSRIEGIGADLIIVDDPHGGDDWQYPELLARQAQWFEASVMTRAHATASVIVIHTRWHPADLTGILSAQGGWQHLVLPAIDEAGNALWPRRFPITYLERRRKEMGDSLFSALYQQQPSAMMGGSWFDTSYLDRRHTSTESNAPGDRTFATVDLALTAGQRSDFTCICIWRHSPSSLQLRARHLRTSSTPRSP